MIRIRPVLSFRDGKIENFDKLMKGVKAGETRETLGQADRRRPQRIASRPARSRPSSRCWKSRSSSCPRSRPSCSRSWAASSPRASCATSSRPTSSARLDYHQQQEARRADHRRADRSGQLGSAARAAQAAKPPRAGTGRARAAPQRLQRRRNPGPRERAAAEQRGVARPGLSRSISFWSGSPKTKRSRPRPTTTRTKSRLIAEQSGESARRVRARLEKQGLMDALRNQIIERKVIELVLSPCHVQGRAVQGRGCRRRSARPGGRRRGGERIGDSRSQASGRGRAAAHGEGTRINDTGPRVLVGDSASPGGISSAGNLAVLAERLRAFFLNDCTRIGDVRTIPTLRSGRPTVCRRRNTRTDSWLIATTNASGR